MFSVSHPSSESRHSDLNILLYWGEPEQTTHQHGIHTLYTVWLTPVDKTFEQWLGAPTCVEQSSELFTDIRGRGGASNVAMLALVNKTVL